jgi:hypothetical protein
MKIEIKSWLTRSVLFEGDFSCIADAVKAAVKSSTDLRYADLSSADLSSADLRYADLRYANLSSANLSYANLRYANLSSADLRYANLRSANLRSADLSSVNLSSADLRYAVDSWAQVAFMGHGECGRMLTAIRIKKDGNPTFFCGCFTGTLKQLEEYIEKGAPNLKKTRTLAMKAVVEMLDARNTSPECLSAIDSIQQMGMEAEVESGERGQ